MKFNIYFSPKAHKQYQKLDAYIKSKFKLEVLSLEKDPYQKSSILSGKLSSLRCRKFSFQGVQYRIVYDINRDTKEVLIIFLGTRENFYKELTYYIN